MGEKTRLYSGMQATGTLTLGNYLGALKNWKNMQDEYDCYFGVADLHSLTVRQNPADFRKNARSLYALYLAVGLDPQKACIYFQSHVGAHCELAWILNCFTYMGELNRMTQFKDKSLSHSDNVNAGLFTYPVLMAADILLYQAAIVPVGLDQKQHLEITRDIAERFNNIYSETFTIPEPYFGKNSAKVMSLSEPEKKMSKSDENKNATIYLIDDKDTIIRKFKRAVTDSDSSIKYSADKPGISNLIEIYSSVSKKSIEEIEKEFDGKGYGEFKLAVGEAVADDLYPIQQRYYELLENKDYIDECINENAKKAWKTANRTLSKVKKKVGLLV